MTEKNRSPAPVSHEKITARYPDNIQQCRILIVGTGMIGGSLAAALRQRQVCRLVAGWDKNRESLITAEEQWIVDSIAESLDQGVKNADIIVLATPVMSMASLMQSLQKSDLSNKIVTDVASCKQPIADAAIRTFGTLPSFLIPGHPIAGSEKSGINAANPELFVGKNAIVTPTAQTHPHAEKLICEMWQHCGAKVLKMSLQDHDAIFARTSHLPHVLAFSLVETLASGKDNLEIFRYAAGGFADFTRIAGSDPTMWHDIFMTNKQEVLAAINEFSEGLEKFRAAINKDDSDTILTLMKRARDAREYFSSLINERD